MSVKSDGLKEIGLGKKSPKYVALGSRLVGIPEVLTLGVRSNFHDYTLKERQKIHDAEFILYPSLNYAQYNLEKT